MGTISDSFKRFCKTNGIGFETVKDAILIGMHGRNAVFRSYIQFYESNQFVQFETILPMRVPKDKKNDVATLVLHLNYRRTFGQFLYDASEGILAFEASSFIQAQNDDADRIYTYLLDGSLSVADRFYVLFAKVIFGNLDVDAYCCQDGGEESDDGLEESDSPNNTDTDLLKNFRNN